jgi:hypothetical protein
MKKSFVIASGTAIVAVVLTVGAVSASINPWSIFTKVQGSVVLEEGVTFQPPSNQDKANMVKSIDPVTGKPAMQLQNKAEGLITKTIKMNHDGFSIDLEFDYVNRNGKIVLIPRSFHKPGAVYGAVISIPNTNKNVFEFEGSLYTVDVEKGNIEKLLKDQVSGYSIEDTKVISKQPSPNGGDPFVWWGSRPSINPQGTTLVFFTNRSGKEEVWVKDLISGEEKALIQGAMTPEGWINEEEFVASQFGSFLKIHAKTGESENLGELFSVAVSSPYLVGQKSSGAIEIIDLSNGSSKTLKHESLARASSVAISDKNLYVGILGQPVPEKPKFELLIVNVKDLTTKKLDIPEGKVARSLQWQDDKTVLVNIYELTSRDQEETIVVDIEKL